MSILQAIRDEDGEIAGSVYITQNEYDGSNKLIYSGSSSTKNALDADDVWVISKYTYSGNNVVRVEWREDAIWNNRASLDWKA